MTRYVLLHYAMGDNVVAFRHITNLVRRYPEDEIKLIFNKQTEGFMNYWNWPSNITLCPLTPVTHDLDNLIAFPYENKGHPEWQYVADEFTNYDGVKYCDYRPARIKMLPPQNDAFVFHSYIPERPYPHKLLNRLSEGDTSKKYIAVQPMSTSHTLRFEKEELDIYENWLMNSLNNYFNHFDIKYVLLGTEKDAGMLPNLAASPSTDNCLNLIGKTSLVEFCDIILYSQGVWGISSAGINIGDYLLGKPVLSWNLRDISIELFDSFLHHSKSLAINRPWLNGDKFYYDYINNFQNLMTR